MSEVEKEVGEKDVGGCCGEMRGWMGERFWFSSSSRFWVAVANCMVVAW